MKKSFLWIFTCIFLINALSVSEVKAKRKGCQPSGNCTNGYGDMYYTDSRRNGDRYAGGYQDGKRHGFGTYYWWGNKKGQILESEWVNDQPNGDVLVTYANGSRYKGGWKMTEGRNGTGKLVLKDGSYWLSQWSKDEKLGYAIFYDAFGGIRQETFYHGKAGRSKPVLINLAVFDDSPSTAASPKREVLVVQDDQSSNDAVNKNKNKNKKEKEKRTENKKVKAFFQSP